MVVMVRCLSWAWVRMEVSDAVLCELFSSKLLFVIGVLTAEKESVFRGVATWLRDKDRELKLDCCCFLLLSVLEKKIRAVELWVLVQQY